MLTLPSALIEARFVDSAPVVQERDAEPPAEIVEPRSIVIPCGLLIVMLPEELFTVRASMVAPLNRCRKLPDTMVIETFPPLAANSDPLLNVTVSAEVVSVAFPPLATTLAPLRI